LKRVSVATGGGSYEILIGHSAMAGSREIGALAGDGGAVLLVNETVMRLHGAYLKESLSGIDIRDTILMPDGEEHKSYGEAEAAFNRILKCGLSRSSHIIGVGGGAAGDFAGYLAALYMRGIGVIQVPTTLLAMVDSSIGGKVAVNIGAGKNIVGAFHQPALVVSDIRFLETLPDGELANGLTEAVKHAFIGDEKSLRIFMDNDPQSIKDPAKLEEIVCHSARFKASVVGHDEKEGGLRAILNFGHTVGHAIESLLEYRGISHGAAVALGLKAELDISMKLGWLGKDEHALMTGLLERYGLVPEVCNLPAASLAEHMRYDKKNRDGRVSFVLLKGIGRPVYGEHVDDRLLMEVLDGIFGRRSDGSPGGLS
jgi:3-dehydroquinate synthase